MAVGGGNIAAMALGLVTGVISARALGPALRGEYVAAQTWAGSLVVILTLGVTQAVVTDHGSDSEMTMPLLLQAAGAFVVSTIVFILVDANGRSWLNAAGVSGAAAFVAAGVMTSNASGLAQRKGLMAHGYQTVRIVPAFGGAGAMIIVWISGSHDPNVWLMSVGLTILLLSGHFYVRLLGGLRMCLSAPRRIMFSSEFLRQARGAFAVVIGSQVMYTLDAFLVASFLAPTKVALYAIAVTAGMACTQVGRSVGMVTFSAMRDVTNVNEQARLVRDSARRTFVITVLLALMLFPAMPYLIEILYGQAYVGATGAARLLILASIPLSLDYLLVHVMLMLSMRRAVLRIQLVASILTIMLLGFAIETTSLIMVASVSVIIYTISAALLLRTVLRQFRPSLARR